MEAPKEFFESNNSDSDSEEDNKEVAAIYALELAPATHDVYRQKLRQFVAYLQRTDPALVIDDTTFNCKLLHLKQIELFLIHKQDDDKVSYGVLQVLVSFLFLVLLSYITLQSYRTALIYAYHQAKVDMPPRWLKKLKRYFRGLKRKEAQEKLDGKRSLLVGKAAMPHRLYVWLAKYFLRKGNVRAWAFLTLSWSSICRVSSVADILLSHLEPVTDALGLHVPKSKADQAGARAQIAFQVFANPQDVAQCPLTALAALLALEGTRSEEKLFMGGHQDRRYARDMQLALESDEGKSIMAEVGRAPHSIAPHSTRKGSAAYASNGTTLISSEFCSLHNNGFGIGTNDIKRQHRDFDVSMKRLNQIFSLGWVGKIEKLCQRVLSSDVGLKAAAWSVPLRHGKE